MAQSAFELVRDRHGPIRLFQLRSRDLDLFPMPIQIVEAKDPGLSLIYHLPKGSFRVVLNETHCKPAGTTGSGDLDLGRKIPLVHNGDLINE